MGPDLLRQFVRHYPAKQLYLQYAFGFLFLRIGFDNYTRCYERHCLHSGPLSTVLSSSALLQFEFPVSTNTQAKARETGTIH
jgi:hypothetical protein